MQIGELARQAGVTHRTIHYYERIGLLPPAQRAHAGHRRYDESFVGRLHRIAAFKNLGLSLDEIAEVLSATDGTAVDPAANARALEALKRHLAQAEARMRELFGLRQTLVADIARLEASGRDADGSA
jgi:DNA-binding transcriptional MerR regulator